jgi:TM2 domain-containing membrane protein YozV
MKKTILFILFLFIISISFTHAQDIVIDSTYKYITFASKSDTIQSINEFQYKSKSTAFLSSVVFPGLGQFYNGQKVKAIIFLGIGGFFYGTAMIPTRYEGDSIDRFYRCFLGMCVHLLSIIDAPISAAWINHRNQSLNRNLGNVGKLSVSPSILLAHSAGTKTAYHPPTCGLSLKINF